MLAGCATASGLGAAERAKALPAAIGDAAAISGAPAPLPEFPADCRRAERAGVTETDRLDAALVKYDGALGRANARTQRCADFYAAVKAAHQQEARSGAAATGRKN